MPSRQAVPQPPIDGPAYMAEILGRLPEKGPRDVAAALGPTGQAVIQVPAVGSSITTSSRRLAPEAPDPTTSLAP